MAEGITGNTVYNSAPNPGIIIITEGRNIVSGNVCTK